MNDAEREAIRIRFKQLQATYERTFGEKLPQETLLASLKRRVEEDKVALVDDFVRSKRKDLGTEQVLYAIEWLSPPIEQPKVVIEQPKVVAVGKRARKKDV